MKNNTSKIILILTLVVMVATLTIVGQQKGKEAEELKVATFEYASFSSMGNNSSIIWPDGSVLKLADQFKRPAGANEKMFYMTMALNLLEKNGYSLYLNDSTPMFMNVGHENDLVFRRRTR